MKVLITGGAGYLGSVTSRRLFEEKHQVRILDSLIYGKTSLWELSQGKNLEFVQGDIRSTDTVKKALVGTEVVVHLAALVGDPACARQPVLANVINVDASLKLFELSRNFGVKRFIFASTCSNYGRMSDPSQYVTEESTLRPLSLYARSKVTVEQELLKACQHDSPFVTILRFATLFGLSPQMRFDLTVNEFTMELFTKRKLVVYGKEFWRPYLHVQDAAEAIAVVLRAPAEKIRGEVFNVGDTKENYRKGEIVELICSQIGNHVKIEEVSQGEDPRDYRVSFEKIKQKLNFRVTRTVEDGIREVISAIRQGVFRDLDHPIYRN